MTNFADYDTELECQQYNGVWVANPAPLCYLPSNNLPADRIELVQPALPSNAIYYQSLQSLSVKSMQLGAWLYLVLWACGIFTRMVRAKA